MNVINYSIIIPHYNIPDLLIRCLKSIPVREDIQVIVVDDCSPDAIRYLKDYPELSRPYLEYYSTLKGGSAGRARNVGLDHAKGRWLIFLDADDLLTPDAGQILDETIDRTEDIIFYNTTCVMSDDLSKASDRNFYGHYFEEFVSNHDEIPFRYRFHSLWGKVIRRDLVISNKLVIPTMSIFLVSLDILHKTLRSLTDHSSSLPKGEDPLLLVSSPKRAFRSKNVRLDLMLP